MQLHVGGRAAMLLEYDSFRRTLDVDCRIDGDVAKVLEVANLAGRRNGLDEGWLNQNMWMAWPQNSDEQATTVYADDHLVVTVASPEHLLAMKVRTGRQKDRLDICHLAHFLQFSSAKQVWDLHDKVVDSIGRRRIDFYECKRFCVVCGRKTIPWMMTSDISTFLLWSDGCMTVRLIRFGKVFLAIDLENSARARLGRRSREYARRCESI